MSKLPNISFVGSTAVGKTTLVKKLSTMAEFGRWQFIESVGDLVDWRPDTNDEVAIAKYNQERHVKLSQAYYDSWLGGPSVVTDRYFIDRLAWELAWPSSLYHDRLAGAALEATLTYAASTILFYIPIEFELAESSRGPHYGIRETYAEKIHQLIQVLPVEVTSIGGSVEARIDQILIRLRQEEISLGESL